MPFGAFLAIFVLATSATAAAGVWLPTISGVSKRLVPASGAVLILTAAIWIVPELVETFGWFNGMLLLAAALAGVFLIDKFVHPVCPSCSHSHDHDACQTRLHGFAGPLLTGMGVHNLFDGWMLAHGHNHAAAGHGLWAAVLLHKLPECIAFGVILSAAARTRRQALVWAVLVQFLTVAGAVLEPVTETLGPASIGVLLAAGGATFLYLGVHALHGEWKRRTAAALRAG